MVDVCSVDLMCDVVNVFIVIVGLFDVVIVNVGILVGMDLCEFGDLKVFVVVMDINWMGVFNMF